MAFENLVLDGLEQIDGLTNSQIQSTLSLVIRLCLRNPRKKERKTSWYKTLSTIFSILSEADLSCIGNSCHVGNSMKKIVNVTVFSTGF